MFEFVKKLFSKIKNTSTGVGHHLIKPIVCIFPCKECIITYNVCRRPCNQLIFDNQKLTEKFIKYECCVDCGGNKISDGPCGGVSQNIKCIQCGHEFNAMGPMGFARIGKFVEENV